MIQKLEDKISETQLTPTAEPAAHIFKAVYTNVYRVTRGWQNREAPHVSTY